MTDNSEAPVRVPCGAFTDTGKPCSFQATPGKLFCGVHLQKYESFNKRARKYAFKLTLETGDVIAVPVNLVMRDDKLYLAYNLCSDIKLRVYLIDFFDVLGCRSMTLLDDPIKVT